MEDFEVLKNKISTNVVNLQELLSTDKKYIIPIYQRPYNWEENHIKKFIATLTEAFYTNVFIGNMEFKEVNDQEKELEIIDGQQRVTTLLLLLNYLNNEDYSDKTIQTMLDLRISQEDEEISEKTKFENFINNKNTEEIKNKYETATKKSKRNKLISNYSTENIYRLNYFFLKQALEEAQKNIKIDYNELYRKILSNVYVITVTLSNDMNDSDAIKIFDVINTTGKPLETSDVFKIKMYDYAKRFNKNIDTFQNVNNLYSSIKKEREKIINAEEEQTNEIIKESGKDKEEVNIVSEQFYINDILRIYKYILIINYGAKENLNELHRIGLDTFYNSLFECLLNNISRKEFNGFKQGINEQIIKYEELNDIFEKYLEVSNMFLKIENKEYAWLDKETYFAYKMLKGGYTRYSSSYYFLPAMFYWKFFECKEEFKEFIQIITKLFAIYSILKDQTINYIKNFTNDEIIKRIVKASKNDKETAKQINEKIKEKIKEVDRKTFGDIIEKNLDSWYKKEILCLIIAKNEEEQDIRAIKNLFLKKFDIEHICARESEGTELDDSQKDRIGNLMVLEYSINRSIKNKEIIKKLDKYSSSKFQVVLNQEKEIRQCKEYKKHFEERNKQSVDEIIKYFFSDL